MSGRPENPPVSPEDRARMLQAYAVHGSIDAVRLALGFSRSTIGRALRVANVVTLGRKSGDTPERDARILALRTAGVLPVHIAAQVYGTRNADKRVSQRLRALGWTAAPPPPPPERSLYDNDPLPACHPLALDVLRVGGAWFETLAGGGGQ